QTRQADYGIVENGDRSAFDDERITITEYAINTNAWILRTPRRTVVQDENGATIARSETFYDDETFSGNNFGMVTVGNLTMRRDWLDPSNATAFVRSARIKYDTFGNAIGTFDPLSDGADRIRYYHPDHLGSSSVMTDAEGTLVEETAFYPFGEPRNEHHVR